MPPVAPSSNPSFVTIDAAYQHERGGGGHDDDLVVARPMVVYEYYGRSDQQQPGPQGFLVDFPAHSRVNAHFHSCNQFQVFYPAPGAVYKGHPIDSTLVHYADAYATYGPFSTGAADLRFFTLRQVASTITAYMPHERDRLIKSRPTRNVTGAIDQDTTSAGSDVIPEHADGLAAHVRRLAPGEAATFDEPQDAGGAYALVLEGAVDLDGQRFPVHSLAWLAPGVAGARLTGAADGAALVVLRFPRRLAEW